VNSVTLLEEQLSFEQQHNRVTTHEKDIKSRKTAVCHQNNINVWDIDFIY